jgi:hypothetical protein
MKELFKFTNNLNLYFSSYYCLITSTFLFFGYPLAQGDDLFFTGTAAWFAKYNQFENPLAHDLLRQLNEYNYKPYWFVTFHPWILGWWLKIVGISNLSILIFVNGYTLVSIFALDRIVNVIKGHQISKFVIPFVIYFGFANSLRPDGLGVTFFLIGLLYLLKSNLKFYYQILSFLFMGLACITWHYLVGFAVSSILFWSALNYNSKEFNNYFNKLIPNIVISFVIIFTIFLLTIDFELEHFLDVFWKSVNFRRGSNTIVDTINLLSFGNGFYFRLPIVITSAIITIILLYKEYREISILTKITLLLTLCIISGIMLYSNSYHAIILISFINILLFISRLKSILMTQVTLSITFLFLILNGGTTFLLTTVYHESEPKLDAMTKEIIIGKYEENKTFVIDSISARTVFNWNFPAKTRMAPGSAAKDSDILNKNKDEIWVVSNAYLAHTYPTLYSTEKLKLFGRKFGTVPISGNKIIVIE